MTTDYIVRSRETVSSTRGGRTRLRSGTTHSTSQPPAAVVSPDQLYYWSRTWQENEQAALAEIAAGKAIQFDDPVDAIAWLMEGDED